MAFKIRSYIGMKRLFMRHKAVFSLFQYLFISGLTAVLCTYPLDVVRARLAFQVAGDELYQGIMHAFYTMFTKEGGVKAFYKGIIPTMLGMAPYAGT